MRKLRIFYILVRHRIKKIYSYIQRKQFFIELVLAVQPEVLKYSYFILNISFRLRSFILSSIPKYFKWSWSFVYCALPKNPNNSSNVWSFFQSTSLFLYSLKLSPSHSLLGASLMQIFSERNLGPTCRIRLINRSRGFRPLTTSISGPSSVCYPSDVS